MDWIEWSLAGLAAFMLGLSKSGIKGIGIFIVTLMALVFGGRESTGVLIPLLIFGDLFAVVYYNRHANWQYIFKLLPWVVIGVLIGVVTGNHLQEEVFTNVMIIIILVSVGFMAYREIKTIRHIPQNRSFAGIMGTLLGFATMIGNLAGPFANVYFLAMQIPKNTFIGTTAWLFFIVNIFKLPFHLFVWETVNAESFHADLYLFPIQFLGLITGIKLIRGIPEKFYRILILTLTGLGVVLLLFR